MIKKLKDIVNELNDLTTFIEKDEEFKVINSLLMLERNISLISKINSLSASSDKVETTMVMASLKINKDKISKIEGYIKTAKTNLFNIAEIHSYLEHFKDKSEFLLISFDFTSDDLEKEVLRFIPAISKMSDKDLANYFRESLLHLKTLQ